MSKGRRPTHKERVIETIKSHPTGRFTAWEITTMVNAQKTRTVLTVREVSHIIVCSGLVVKDDPVRIEGIGSTTTECARYERKAVA